MGTLNVTNIQKYGEFTYTDNPYVLTGSFRATDEGEVTSVDNGQIVKNGNYLGNFYIYGENGSYTTNVNNVPIADLAAVSTAIADCVSAINGLDEGEGES